jgi:UDP-glucose 4-epimerase
LSFVESLIANGCHRLIFSSSAALYRAATDGTVDETSDVEPQSPYARTKAVVEIMLQDIAHTQAIRVLSLSECLRVVSHGVSAMQAGLLR